MDGATDRWAIDKTSVWGMHLRWDEVQDQGVPAAHAGSSAIACVLRAACLLACLLLMLAANACCLCLLLANEQAAARASCSKHYGVHPRMIHHLTHPHQPRRPTTPTSHRPTTPTSLHISTPVVRMSPRSLLSVGIASIDNEPHVSKQPVDRVVGPRHHAEKRNRTGSAGRPPTGSTAASLQEPEAGHHFASRFWER